MKNTTHLVSAFLLSCLLATSCTSSSVVDESSIESGEPIAFGSKVMNRAVVDATKKGMGSFSVWGWFQPSTQTTGPFTNVFNATEVQPGGTYEGTRYWMDGQTYDFYALHPAVFPAPSAAVATCQEQGQMTVTDFDALLHRGKDAVDLMSAHMKGISYVSGTTPLPVPLTFSHELAWVEVSIASEQPVTIHYARFVNVGYKGDWTIRPNVQPSWKLKAYSDAVTGEPLKQTKFEITEADVKAKKFFHMFGGNSSVDMQNGDLLLPPQQLDACEFTMKWSYTGMPNEVRVVRVKLPQTGVNVWEKGKHYVYSAVIPPTPAEVTLNVSVKPWNNKRLDVEL